MFGNSCIFIYFLIKDILHSINKILVNILVTCMQINLKKKKSNNKKCLLQKHCYSSEVFVFN